MKLAILGTRGIPARYGGFETFAEELAKRLVARGVETTVYCEADNGEMPAIYKGVRLVYIAAPGLGPFTTILFDLCCLWHARKKFDVVYMLGYGASLFLFIPRLWNCRVWVNMDGIEWMRSKWSKLAKIWFKLMEAIAVKASDRIIADAEGIRQHLQSRHKHVPYCSVIPYGANIVENAPHADIFNDWKLTAGKYYLLVCRLEPENNVLEVIEGFMASESNCPLVVVGDHAAGTSYVERILRTANKQIKFIGALYDRTKLQTLRYHSLAYFHGHTVGGTNPSLLEALGCGNIVIAHDNQFNREVAGEAALYFNRTEDIPALVRRVETYIPEDRKRMEDSAKRRIRENYDWDKITREYFLLLKAESGKTRQVAHEWVSSETNVRIKEQ